MNLLRHIVVCEILKGAKTMLPFRKSPPDADEIMYELKTIRVRAKLCGIEQALAYKDQKNNQILGRSVLYGVFIYSILSILNQEHAISQSEALAWAMLPASLSTACSAVEKFMRNKLHKWMDQYAVQIEQL